LKEVVIDEMMLREPEEIRRDECQREKRAKPGPRSAEIFACVGEKNAGEDAGGKEENCVLVEQAEADGNADEEEVVWVGGAQEFHDEKGSEDPEEVIERSVMHEGARAESEGNGGGGGNELREAAPTNFFGHAASEEHADGLQQGGEETKADQRSAEEGEGETAEEGRERRVSGIAPCEVAGVFEEGEFVAIKAIALSNKEVQEECRAGDTANQRQIAAG